MATIQNALCGRQEGLQAELQAILPLSGDPFRKEGAQFHPLFELILPKEHYLDLSKENELGSEAD
jgi:hypothetical protein